MKTFCAAFLALTLWALTANAATPQPIIKFGTAAPSIMTTASSGTVLSSILVTLNTGGTFTGTIALTSSAGGVCAISSSHLPSNLTVGGATLAAGNFTCTVQATQGSATSAASITIQVKAATPIVPIIALGSPTPSVIYATIVGTPLSTIAVTMSDGSKFTGSLSFGAPHSNDGGICALSKTTLPSNIVLGQRLAMGMPVQNCTVVATQGATTASANIAITVTAGDPPVVTFGTPAPTIPNTTPAGTTLSSINVTNSDGSVFTGNITFGTPYSDGGGACALAGLSTSLAVGTSVSLVAPTTGTLVDSDGTWSFGPSVVNAYGYPLLLNGVQVNGGVGVLLLSYNGHTYAETSPNNQGWYEWGGSTWSYIGTTDPRPPGSGTLVDADGTWSFGPSVNAYGSQVLLNGTSANGGVAALLVSYNGHTYAETSPNPGWYEWSGSWSYIGTTDPRSPPSVTLGKVLTAGTYNCTVTATQGTVSGSANIQITSMSPATPTVTLGSPAPTVPNTTPVGTPLSTIAVTMSDGSKFSGTLSFGAPYSNDGGICAISGSNLTLGAPFPSGNSTQQCTVVATQGANSASANITITVTVPTPTVTFGTPAPTIPNTTPAGTTLSTINVTMSDGSAFTGNLAFGGTYGNGGGACALGGVGTILAVGTSVSLVAPTTGTLVDSDGTWSFGPGPPSAYGYPLLLNGAPANGGVGALLLSYNGHTYAETDPDQGWYEWAGGWSYIGTTDPRPPGSGTLVDSDGTWSFGPSVNAYGSQILLNGAPANGGVGALLLSYNGHTYAETSPNPGWYEWSGGWSYIGTTDPRSAGSVSVTLGKLLTAGTYNCTVTATQGTVSGSANIQITSMSPATPTVTLGSPAPTVPNSTPVGTPLSTIAVTMSNGSKFTGSLSFGAPYSNDGGICAISGSNLVLGQAFPSGNSTQNCTVVATQGAATSSANITMTVTGLTYSTSLNPSTVTIPDSTPPGANLSNVTVTASDGSSFMGTVVFGGTNGNGGGSCSLVGTSVSLVAPTTNTLVDSDGTWSFGPNVVSAYGYPLLLNGAPANGGVAALLLSYNGYTYAETAPDQGWYEWSGGWSYIGTTDPRPPGSGVIALAQTLPAGTYNCDVQATTP